MANEKIYRLLVAANKIPSKEIKEDMSLIAEIAGKIGSSNDNSTALMRSINIEFVETALNRLLTNVNSGKIKPQELQLVVSFLVKIQKVFNENLKDYHEHDATLKLRMGNLGNQLNETIDDLKAKNDLPTPRKKPS